jgi:hypothetical protein
LVNKHHHIFQHSLGLICLLESMPLSQEQDRLLTSADVSVAAQYPSTDVDDGMKAL